MKKLFYKLYARYTGFPHRRQVNERIKKQESRSLNKRISARMYVAGHDVSEIAEEIGVSRERVRQLLWAVVRS